jgi:3-hydroxyisobutyrate dehydrogenase-like beta-hydroxyacid dehydrogenase
MTETPVAMIGLGMMGAGIAGRLIDAGFDVTVHNRTAAAAEPFAARGARIAASPGAAVTPGGIAISMLANDAALDSVASGPDGIAARLGQAGIHISMSTISPSLAARLAADHKALGGAYLGAPVFGRPDAAASGKLWIALAGDAAAKERAKPVLTHLSQGIQDFGDKPEVAHAAKIAGNFLIAASMEAMAEAFTLVTKNGGDPKALHALLTQGILACPIYQNYGRFILNGEWKTPGFKLELGAKDMRLVLANGLETNTPMPFAGLLVQRYTSALAKGHGNLDWTAIAQDVAADAGLS